MKCNLLFSFMYKAFTKGEQFVTELKDLKVDRSGMMCIEENWHDFHFNDETFQCKLRQQHIERSRWKRWRKKKLI